MLSFFETNSFATILARPDGKTSVLVHVFLLFVFILLRLFVLQTQFPFRRFQQCALPATRLQCKPRKPQAWIAFLFIIYDFCRICMKLVLVRHLSSVICCRSLEAAVKKHPQRMPAASSNCSQSGSMQCSCVLS